MGISYYYLTNFQTLLDTLTARDGDLLDPEERGFIARFAGLPRYAQALLVRMVMRRGTVFRASRLNYPEIPVVGAAMRPLIDLYWVHEEPELALDDLFRLATKADIGRYLRLSRQQTAKPKAALLAELRASFPGSRRFAEWFEHCADRVYRLEVNALCGRLCSMFFGNARQDLTEFVLADLGVFTYERVELHPESRPFRTRRQVDDFHALAGCRAALNSGVEPVAVAADMPPPSDCDWLEERRQKLLFQIGRAYERSGERAAAAATYADCTHPEARPRLQRLQPVPVPGGRRRAPGKPPPQFSLELPKRPGMSVEHNVIEHLRTESDDAETCLHHVENGLINSLFGLWCWPALFAPVRGAFFHAFHRGPADLTSSGFVTRREREFTACFAQLRDGSYKDALRHRLTDKAGVCCPFVAWGLLSAELLETALHCFPATHLARWFEWLLRDLRRNRSGFPDLVQFWPRSGRYRLIEVKGPGDRLQDNQRRCLEYCLDHDMPVSVCHVRWTAVPANPPQGPPGPAPRAQAPATLAVAGVASE